MRRFAYCAARLAVAALVLSVTITAQAQQTTIAYWAQNDNELPGGGFGFGPESFPQAADVGEGFLSLRDFIETTNAEGAFTTIQSFAGTTANALPGFPSGGSLSPQGGTGLGNNGMSIVLEVDTTGFENIEVSWAQRGTSTGFTSRQFAYSADGVNFTDVGSDTGALGSSWQVQSHDLSDVEALADNDSVIFRITLDGASGTSGNNRFDNILIQATPVGAPSAIVFETDFATDPFQQGWSDINITGDQVWEWSGNFQNVSFAPFVGGSCQINENWFISPGFDLADQSGELLLFDVARGFPGDNDLEVLYSTDWAGIGDPRDVEWNTIAILTSDEFNDVGNNVPKTFGAFDDLQSADATVFVASRFVYESGNCATWRVSAFQILAEADDSEPVEFACGNDVTRIHRIQGAGFSSPRQGQSVQVEAIVVGEFQSTDNGGLGGFFIQEADIHHDDDPLTSEGIFVFDNNFGVDVGRGDRVRVAGSVAEFFGETQIESVTDLEICATGQLDQVTPAVLELPVSAPIELEAVEGMWVTTTQELTVTDVFNAVRFGEIQVSSGRLFQPTQVVDPGAPAQALQAANDLNRIIIDDARSGSNRTPFIIGGDNFNELSAANPIRSGYTIEPGFEGFMGFAFSRYRLRPLERPGFVPASNPRTAAPEVAADGNLRVASYNVENLFTTLSGPGSQCGPNLLSCRGAETESELERQLAKLSAAIQAMDADLIALVEIENDADDSTLARLIDAVNAAGPIGDWAFVPTGFLGTDAIKPAFIYRAGRIQPEGDFAVLDSSVDERFDTSRQRPALAQTFRAHNSAVFTAVAVHLRAKGSCPAPGDPNADQGDGQACWNLWRTRSTEALADWIGTDPTGAGDADFLLLGDFNAYAREDPIAVLEDAGFVNLANTAAGGSELYSFTFFGQAGSLDHGFASSSMFEQIIDAAYWPINADEIPVFNFSEGLLPGQPVEKPASFFEPDPFRSSDHDPLIIELDVTPCAPGFFNRPEHPGGQPLPLPRC